MQKIRNKIVLPFLSIMLIFTMCLETFAKDYTYDGNNGGGVNNSKYENFATSRPDIWMNVEDQGIRVYVTDDEGNLQLTKDKKVAIDFTYKNNDVVSNPRHLRAAKGDIGGESTKDSLSVLGFEVPVNKQNYWYNLIWDCWTYNLKNPEMNVVKNHLLLTGEEYHIRNGEKIDITYGTSDGMKYGEYIIKQYYPDIYKNFRELSDIDEGYYSYSLHIEHIFAVTKKNGSVVWSGSVYEAAYEKAPLGDFKTNFLSSMAKALYVSDTYSNMALNDVSNFPHLLPVTNLKTTSYAEIKDHAYGYNVFGLKDLITKPKETQETEPPTGGIKIKKDKELTMKKIENVDNVEIYTGYAAQNGYYDIGTNGGIPTTEEIRNVIRAQDFIIDYAYNFLKYVPEEFPVVTYKLTYYVPCKCKRTCIHTTHHSAEYDNDGNKIKDEWTEYKHKDGDVGYHGNSYHKSTDTYTVSIPRAAVYYKITDYKIYALETVNVSNQAGSAYYDGLSPINSVDAIISGEDNPTNIKKEALDKHIDYTDVNNLEFDNAGIGEGVFSSKAAAESWYNNNGFKFGDSKVGYPKVANDQLIINFNDDRGSLQLMDSTWVSKEHMNDQYVVVPDKPLAVPKYRMVEAEQQHIEIPYDLMNGNYSTTINAYYHLYAGTEDHAGYVLFSNAAKPGHIMPESVLLKNNNSVSFESQEPIHIMTPIISPFETTDSNKLPDLTEDEKAKMTENEIKEYERKQLQSGTQLVTEEDCQQLRLDEEYTLSFDPFMHNLWLGYGYSGLIDNENYWSGRDGLETDNKFDKYVKEKWIKFPFDVYIQNKLFGANTWICVYEYDPVSDKVSAGDLDTPCLTKVEYYIPSWAIDSMNDINENGTGIIETSVRALNYNGSDIHQANYNPSDNETWSFNAITVQLSGWLYDFEVVGVHDKADFVSREDAYENNKTWNYNATSLSLAGIKDEFYMGKYNRLGNDKNGDDTLQRRQLDDTLEDTGENTEKNIVEDYDLLPLNEGSSEYQILGGTLKRGSSIGFNLKTMDNLKDDDLIEIIPTYTYYSDDMTKKLTMDEMEIYFDNGTQKFIKMGSDRDNSPIKSFYWNNTLIDNTVTDEEKIYTLKNGSHKDGFVKSILNTHYETASSETVLVGDLNWEHKIPTASMSKIMLTDLAMMYVNPLTELKQNLAKDGEHATDMLGSSYESGNIALKSKVDAQKQSVQQWTGSYMVPKYIRILDIAKLNEMGYSSFEDYLNRNTYVTGKEDFWITKGKLVLNFKITAYKNDKPYLTMESGTSDQWLRQGMRENLYIGTYITRQNALKLMKQGYAAREAYMKSRYSVPTKSGDIAVIDINYLTQYLYAEAVAFS